MAIGRWIAALRRWWWARSVIVLTFPCGHQHAVQVTEAESGVYAITIDGRRVAVRARWWHTRGAVARMIRRAIRSEIGGVS